MSTKSDYTPEEWQLLIDVPSLAGLAVMVAGKSGLGSMKESFALASGVLDAAQAGECELVDSLVAARVNDKDRSQVESLTSPYRGKSTEELMQAALDKCSDVLELLAEKSTPDESLSYREWVLGIGQRVAEAAKEGGFLGIGGERVSEHEREALAKLKAALELA
ncbi:MAG: hypothetical protein KDA60_11675 [Planctomycetales bacterium]|nr:hypothetical protein [Planctomycetales bacterium]